MFPCSAIHMESSTFNMPFPDMFCCSSKLLLLLVLLVLHSSSVQRDGPWHPLNLFMEVGTQSKKVIKDSVVWGVGASNQGIS